MKHRFISKILIFAIVAIMLNIFCIQGFAAQTGATISNVSISHDSQNSKLIITGAISSGSGCEVTVTVTTPTGVIDFIDQVTSGSGGSFTFEYVYDELLDGQYLISIGGIGVDLPYSGTWQKDGGQTGQNLMVITAPDRVYSHDTFEAGIGISDISPNIYAMIITLNYNAQHLEYIKTEKVDESDENIMVLSTLNTPGLLKIVKTDTTSFSDIEQAAKVTFRVRSGISNVTSNIQITSAELGVAPGGEVIFAELADKTISVLMPGDVSGDGDVDVGDLAIVAYYYGKTSEDEDWHLARVADFNGDNRVDFIDLAFVAQKMLD